MGLTLLSACFICKTSKPPFFPKAPPILAQFHLPPTSSSPLPPFLCVSSQRYLISIGMKQLGQLRAEHPIPHSPTPRATAPGMTQSRPGSPALPSPQSRRLLYHRSQTPSGLPNYAPVWLVCKYSHISSLFPSVVSSESR